jgi:Tfp pilus assembly protein PilF
MKADFDLRKSAAMLAQRKQAIEEATRSGGKISDELTRGMSDEEKQALQKAADDRAEQLKKNKALDDSYSAAVGFLNQKQYDQAIPSFQKAAELDPKQPAVWAGLADAYLGLASTKTGAEYDAEVQKGIDAYNKAIELKPTDAGLHNNYGRALAAARKTTEAQAEMSKAAELDPAGAGKYYYNLGAILTNSGQTDAAAEAFKKATVADPNYADAYYQLGVGLVGKAQIDTATGKVTPAPGTVEAFQKYLELAPQGQFAGGRRTC